MDEHQVELEEDVDESDMKEGKKPSNKVHSLFNLSAEEQVIHSK